MPYYSPLMELDGDDGSRVCRVCGERKPLIEYFFTRNKNHRRRICKSCVADQRQRNHEAQPQIRAAAGRRTLLKRYNLTEASYHAWWIWQGGRCAICFEDLVNPHVDHDHETGQVRGLLCFTCNTALGKFKDSKQLLLRAIAYLENR